MIDNAGENALTAMFSGEYAGQFGYMLPLLARWGFPMPLGGTSNHFRTRTLLELGGWDAFNVTEDADLGVRLSRRRLRTGTLPSRTLEEAPVSLPAWMNQRTRWIKGWAQTFIVHNRDPAALLRQAGWRGFLGFEIYVGGLLLSALLHSVFAGSLLIWLVLGMPLAPESLPWAIAHGVVLVGGYTGAYLLVIAGLVRVGQRRLLLYQVLLPFYWVLHSVAAVRAAHELIVRPYLWRKTTHGRTSMGRSVG